MLRYVILGKYSQDFLSGLIYNPQDRIIPDFKSNASSRIEQKN